MDGSKNQKQSFFKKFFNDKGAMLAAIVVAIVGIVGLVSIGFDQISFAADYATMPEVDKFKSAMGTQKVSGYASSIQSGQNRYNFLGFYAITDDAGTRMPIFCVEFDVDYAVDQNYDKGTEVADQGLIYLMSQLYPNKPLVDEAGNEYQEGIQMWVTQTAIWSYLYEVGDSKNSTFGETNTIVKAVDQLSIGDSVDATPVLTTPGSTVFEKLGINTLIVKAKEYRANPVVNLTVKKASDTISITNDNKYYQSDVVSVLGQTSSLVQNFESYSVTLNNAPEGTILVDEAGNKYENLDNMAPTAKFYVRVPVEKVTDALKEVQINIRGNFKMPGGHYYVSGANQKVAAVKTINKSEDKPLNIQLNYTPDVPDTGMSVAQTIYFIGLIILLSGVGIIYVNAKPEESK